MRRSVVLLALLVLPACGGGAEPQTASTRKPVKPSLTPASEPSTAPGVTCLPVEQALLDQIATQSEASGALTLSGGQAFLSPDYEQVYFVAARMAADGLNDVGVWATNDIAPGQAASILAVDGFAQQFTAWPDADSSGAEISKADPAVATAKDCVS